MERSKVIIKCFLVLQAIIFLQNTQAQKSMTQKRVNLLELAFEELVALEDSLDAVNETSYLNNVLDVHISKAKLFKDTIELIDTYRWRVWREDFNRGIKYADSAIHLAGYIKNKKYPAKAHYTKGALLYENNYPEEALDEFIKGYNSANQYRNYEVIVDCINAIAGLKREFGQELESTILQRKSLDYLDKFKDEIGNFDLTYLITLDNLSRSYIQVKNIDSARVFINRGKNLALEMKDNQTYSELSILQAQVNYYDGNFLKAKDSLLKYIGNFEGEEKADILFYLGMIEGKLGEEKNKINLLRSYDSILSTVQYPLIDNVKEAYRYLIKQSYQIDNLELQKRYLNRLVYYDSLENDMKNRIKLITLTEFDIPQQEAVSQGFQDRIYRQNKLKQVLYLTILLIIIAFSVIFTKFIFTRKKLKRIMQSEVKPIVAQNRISKTQGLDSSIVNEILERLELWESNHGFLNQDTNQNDLAKELDTNSTYLSKVINFHKGQSFSNYIKDLRITHAINFLRNNPGFIDNKSTIQVAEEFGFNSVDVFTRALRNKIGVTPAVFFKQLKRGNL